MDSPVSRNNDGIFLLPSLSRVIGGVPVLVLIIVLSVVVSWEPVVLFVTPVLGFLMGDLVLWAIPNIYPQRPATHGERIGVNIFVGIIWFFCLLLWLSALFLIFVQHVPVQKALLLSH